MNIRPADPVRFVHKLIRERALAAPDAFAVHDSRQRITFAALVRRADTVADRLRGLGVRPDTVVGVYLERGVDLVVAALGVLSADAAYLPMDESNPPTRAARLSTAAGCPVVICAATRAPALRESGVKVLPLPAASPEARTSAQAPVPTPGSGLPPVPPRRSARLRPEDLAYVIYTSGSTGTPKGVMVPHGALLNMVRWNIKEFALAPGDRVTMTASPGFDASVWEIWPALVAGACLYVPDDETRLSPQRLRDWLVDQRITVSFLPTPLAELVLGLSWPAGCALRILQTAGDRLHARPAPGLPFRVVNNYGPAENAVVATSGTVAPGPAGTLPSIGRAVDGVEVLLLDVNLAPAGAGTIAEVFLGGAGLGRGYLGRPDLTAERFVADPRPDHPGERLYRTGDLARLGPDGSLDFQGRSDDQVKIRGSRVEPAEVTAALLEHPDVAAACTVVRADPAGGRKLVSYYVARTVKKIPTARDVRLHLVARLPDYLVPADFVLMGRLPVTRNGKVDRSALPAPDPANAHVPCEPPRTITERALVEIWQDAFDGRPIGVHDNFFDLGGHSLAAARLSGRIRHDLGYDVGVSTIFGRPTIAALAKELDVLAPADERSSLPPIRAAERQQRMPLSFVQEQLWFLTKLAPGTTAYHTQATIRVAGPLDIGVLERALTEICRRHESLRTVYEDVAGHPWQVIRDEPPPFRVPVVDLRQVPAREQELRVEEFVAAEMARPFDLSQLPLARWTGIQLGEAEWELVVIEHHFIHDGWSFTRLMGEVRELYRALQTGVPARLPELTLHYADFACWQREALQTPAMQAQLDYWRRTLAGAPPPLSVPTDRPPPPVRHGHGRRLRVEMPPALPDRIRAYCRRQEVSLFTTLFAGFAVLLHRLTGAEDFCVGSAVANRRFPEIEPVLGMFVNNVVLRCDLSQDPSFQTVVGRVRNVILQASASQDVPFSKVVAAVNPPRVRAGSPFFQTMFSFHDSPEPALDFDGSPATLFELHNNTAKVDLDIVVLPRAERQMDRDQHRDGRVTVLWDYATDVLDGRTVARLAEQYHRLIDAAMDDPELPVSRLPLGREGDTDAPGR